MRHALLAASVLLTACGSGTFDPFFVEVKAAAVCQRLTGQKFQVPSELREQWANLPPQLQQGISLDRTFDFDVNAQLPPELEDMVNMHVALTSVKLTVVNPEADFGFIDEGHLALVPTAESGLEARSFDYVRSEAAPRVVAWSGQAFDVAAYLQSGTLKYTVSLTGTMPPTDLVVDVEACAEATVRLDYL